jgi:hypothetical protein
MGKSYCNDNARGGKPLAQGKQDASLRKIDGATKHLTQPSGGAKQVGDQGPREKTKAMPSTMDKVKRIAGGSNY